MSYEEGSEFFCNTCQHSMATHADMLEHSHTEWHRYNVRRRCMSLPPLPRLLFEAAYERLRAATSKKTANVEIRCDITHRTFKNESAYEHFKASKTYKKALEKANSRSSRAAAVAERAARGEAVPVEVVNEEGVVVDKVLYRVPAPEEDVENDAEAALLRRDRERLTSAAPAPAAEDDEEELPASRAPVAESAAAALAAEEAAELARRQGQLPIPTSATALALMAEAGVSPDNLLHRPIPLRYSLFDRVGPFRSVKGCLNYMFNKFGFHIPFVEYLTDLEGLLEYLGAKVGTGHTCLWCHKQFGSLKDVQQHMRDAGHGMISLDDETGQEDEDLLEFYEFTHNIKDEAGAADLAYGQEEADDGAMVDGEEEDGESQPAPRPLVSTLTKEERLQIRAEQRLRTLQLLQLRSADAAVADEATLAGIAEIPVAERALVERPEEVYKGILTFAPARRREIVEKNELGELVLSDGTVIGHRDYKRMYKQRAKTTEQRDPRAAAEAKALKAALTHQYYAMQLPGYTAGTEAHNANVHRQTREGQRARARHENRAGLNYNLILRKHFRCSTSMT